jgi:uncharacterized SAM-binding protein YcdF (DUF218 family)
VATVVWAGWLGSQVLSMATRRNTGTADVIIVLGSAVWPNEQPSPSLAARTRTAIELYEQGRAAHLILTGGLGQWPPAEAEVMRRLAAAAGIPEAALVLDTESRSTQQSLSTASRLMAEHGWRSALIVSDPFHLCRALTMAHDAGIRANAAPALASPTWTIPRLRVYYVAREVVALMAYHVLRVLGLGLHPAQGV